MRALTGVLLPVLLAGFVDGHAQDRARVATTSAIAAQSPCPFTTFEEQTSFTRRFYSKAEYDRAKTNASTECLRIQYLSDGLKVVGFLVKPRDTDARRYPVIIYNRGGLQDMGKIDAPNILDFYELAANGFVVLASQYRGNDGGEGREEFGGADVGDVVTLVSLASSLPYADPKNIFFYGLSRGGMMTFLALTRGASVNAAAVVGGIYDLQGLMESSQQRMPGVANRVAQLIPDYSSRGAAALAERSVMQWPEKVAVPLLMIHGADDEEVPVSQALAFAAKLSSLRKPYELIVYAKEIHEALNNRRDRDARIVAWFKRHLR
ncbi:MAG TPA: prolyl oligopeptidase family serine peptidase [Vicinamibacterales bacterium]|jgi:dipeptidyl aminopeptidase/acylaminoacyl peptidase